MRGLALALMALAWPAAAQELGDADLRPVARPAPYQLAAAVPAPGAVEGLILDEVVSSRGGASAPIDARDGRPRARPAPAVEVMTRTPRAPATVAAVPRSPRPVARLGEARRTERRAAFLRTAAKPVVAVDGTLLRSGRPGTRPAVTLAAARGVQAEQRGGGLCGRASIAGRRIPPVAGRGACGIPDAVRVSRVAGVTLSRPLRMDCGTAQALDDWVRGGVIPAVGTHGGGPVQLEVMAGYACRTRNSQAGAKISEHGKGRAVDVGGIRLANGRTISVLGDWGKGTGGRILRAVHAAACGTFGTVLGPESDRFHRDHFHLDTARYRSGSYCR
ncbi:extensin family protein [Jannaschia sp. W003]|uniref:extensin-like domain-containing protein n=1 Tax=Jannaschia sp. W003 TaxID=2867012 RepID=UPI0021A5BE8C|nr:extensin family protein [Jannaschia sp. W003]UWQ22615.1 extensin family protein [Jannaschia sp. W003]